MFKLVILTKKILTEGASKNATSMVPNASFALYANSSLQGASASMRLKTLSAMTDPSFAKIAYCPLEITFKLNYGDKIFCCKRTTIPKPVV